jgi:hypothetical protein
MIFIDNKYSRYYYDIISKAKYGILTNQQKIQKRKKKEKSISINGIIYKSLSEASKITGISLGIISYRATRSKNYPEYFLL